MGRFVRKRWWLFALLALAPIVLLATTTASSMLRTPRPRNLIIISIDTLRADHIGCYGYERPTSPSIDAFAAEGVLFEDSSATSPWTKPSHASMLTGLYPRRHGAMTVDRPMADDVTHMGKWLQEHGFQTAGIVNNLWLTLHGLEQGFGHFQHVPAKAGPAPSEVTGAAITWLKKRDRDKPFFAFVHYMDVHSDYVSMPTYERMFVEPYVGPADGTSKQLWEFIYGVIDLNERDFRHLANRYDAGIRQVDDQIGNLFAYLREEGLLEDSLVLVMSDHGDEFFDHGSAFHGHQQYQEVIHVPLIFRGVGVPTGMRIATPVSLIDVMPTCLSLLGLPTPKGLDGVPLQRLWQVEGAALEPRLLFSESDCEIIRQGAQRIGPLGTRRIVRNDRFKLHYDMKTRETQLFDLAEDPGEKLDVKAKHPHVADVLLKHLEHYLASRATRTQPQTFSDEELKQLEELGYVGGRTSQDEQ